MPRTVTRSTGAGDELTASWHGKLAALLVLAIASASVVYAVLHGLGAFDHSRWFALAQIGMAAGALVMLKALSITTTSPRAGGALVVVTGLALTVMWSFMPPIAVAMLAVTVYGGWRAVRAARGRPAPGQS